MWQQLQFWRKRQLSLLQLWLPTAQPLQAQHWGKVVQSRLAPAEEKQAEHSQQELQQLKAAQLAQEQLLLKMPANLQHASCSAACHWGRGSAGQREEV